MDLNSVNITATQVAKNYFSAYPVLNNPTTSTPAVSSKD